MAAVGVACAAARVGEVTFTVRLNLLVCDALCVACGDACFFVVSIAIVVVVAVGLLVSDGLALLLASTISIVSDESHASCFGTEAKDGKVLGGEDACGIFLSSKYSVELTHGSAAVVRESVLGSIEAKGVLPLAVGHKVIVRPIEVFGILVVISIGLTVVVVLGVGVVVFVCVGT